MLFKRAPGCLDRKLCLGYAKKMANTTLKNAAKVKNDEFYTQLTDIEDDHIDPWPLGGEVNAVNYQMLCKPCNRRKSGK